MGICSNIIGIGSNGSGSSGCLWETIQTNRYAEKQADLRLFYSYELCMRCDSNPDCADVPQCAVCSLKLERGEQCVGANTQRPGSTEAGKTAAECRKIRKTVSARFQLPKPA